MARKTTKKARIFYPCRTPKIPGKERKNAQKSKEFLEKEKKQGNPKKQGKEDQGKGPKIEKIQDHPPGLKLSIEIENFMRATQQSPMFFFMENSAGQD